MFCSDACHGQVVEALATAHGCKTEIEWMKIPYIPLVNDAKMVDLVERVAQRFGEPRGKWERLVEPSMAGEDFAFFAGDFHLYIQTRRSRFKIWR